MGYKYTMRSSEQRFTIFILQCTYIFQASLSRILLHFFSLKRYLFKYRRVLTSTKKNFLQVLATKSSWLTKHKYMLATILVRKNE
jgi:hypothetical protein